MGAPQRRLMMGGALAWNPLSLSPSLYLSADSGITKDGSNLVSQWDDISTNARNLTQGTAAAKPLWVDSVINGNPVIRFDGTDDVMVNVSATGIDNCTLFLLGKYTASAGEDLSFSVGCVGSLYRMRGFYSGFPVFPNITFSDFGEGAFSTIPYDVTGFHLFEIVQSGKNVKINRDGDTQQSFTLSNAPATTGNDANCGWQIGGAVGAAYWTAIDVVDALVFNSALSDENRQKVEGSILHGRGLSSLLPVGHPYKASPP